MIRKKSLFAGAALGVGACVLLPMMLPVLHTVDSVIIRYSNDGSPATREYITSHKHNNREIVLSSFRPGHNFESMIQGTLLTAGFVLFEITSPFRASERVEREKTAALVRNGCIEAPGPAVVVDHETILGFRTVGTQWVTGDTTTVYRSPDLGCFPLKVTTKRLLPDGSVQTLVDRQALSVN